MFQIINGDSLDVLKDMDDNTFDSIVTDPPYGLSTPSAEDIAAMMTAWVTEGDFEFSKPGFMNKMWDAMVPSPALWKEVLRVLKPGGYAVIFAGSRTQDLMGISLRLAGFEVRDTLMWVYGSGMPHGMDVAKAIDKANGHWRGRRGDVASKSIALENPIYERTDKGEPITEEAKKWKGWNTGLKPSYEPIILARKPLVGSVVRNIEEYGVGALNIDGCRTDTTDPYVINRFTDGAKPFGNGAGHEYESTEQTQGRWPTNIVLDEDAAAVVDGQGGTTKSNKTVVKAGTIINDGTRTMGRFEAKYDMVGGYEDEGGVSRYFNIVRPSPIDEADQDNPDLVRFLYVKKASVKEREHGLEDFDKADAGSYMLRNSESARKNGTATKKRANTHSTVKPIQLMRWLCRLVTPKGGLILDPFVGSGTTAIAAVHEGFHVIGIDQDAHYVSIAEARAARAVKDVLEGAA